MQILIDPLFGNSTMKQQAIRWENLTHIIGNASTREECIIYEFMMFNLWQNREKLLASQKPNVFRCDENFYVNTKYTQQSVKQKTSVTGSDGKPLPKQMNYLIF
jgi:hypothetical protein